MQGVAPYHYVMRTPMTMTTRQALAAMRADRKKRQAARDAELDRQDREAAERLHNIKPLPLFSEAAVDGACPKCRGQQFRSGNAGGAALGGFLVAGAVGAVIAAAASGSDENVECVTCGERFRKG